MTSDNEVHPRQFIDNKVAGILFENKADHTTYFGGNIEYIQGIHMLPLLAASGLARTPEFILEEWTTYFSDGRADEISGGWKGIVYGNYALVYPDEAWEFFNSSTFNPAWLDGGASLTWYLAFAAGKFASFICTSCPVSFAFGTFIGAFSSFSSALINLQHG